MNDSIKDTDLVRSDEPPPHAGDATEIRCKTLRDLKSLQQPAVIQWKIDYDIMPDDPLLLLLVIPDVFL